jgi:hypothetical protein
MPQSFPWGTRGAEKRVLVGTDPGSGGVPKIRGVRKKIRRGMEQWKLVGLITRRPLVRIQLPLPVLKLKVLLLC